MDIKNWTRKTSKGFYSLTEVVAWMGYVALAGIVLLVFVSTFARYLLRSPVMGSYELVEETMAIVGGSAIMYAAVRRGHVALDLVIVRFSRRTQMIMRSIFSLLGFGTWVALTYPIYLNALAEQHTTIQNVPDISPAPFTFILAIALFLCSVTLLIQTFHSVALEETIEGKEKGVDEY